MLEWKKDWERIRDESVSTDFTFYLGPNMGSTISSVDVRSNEEDIKVITAQQVTQETHL